MSGEPVGIGLLGCGTVGSALVDLLVAEADVIESRTGMAPEIRRVAVRDPFRERDVPLAPLAFTGDAASVVEDPDVDVVVEVMGGIEPAKELVLSALRAGKPVVTANKELLATHGAELYAAAEDAGVDLLFEAAVAGGIPLVRPMRESLLGEPIGRVMGIMNGTTNYVLTRMSEDGDNYSEALAEAQRLGYAEADPTADVSGSDAAAKLAILATLAFGYKVTVDDVFTEGIERITPIDVAFAQRHGFVVKLLAIAEAVEDSDGPERIAVRVHPALVPHHHPLAAVRDSFNAVFVEGEAVGELMFYGRGAGGAPTASALLGDLLDAATNRRKGSSATLGALADPRFEPVDELHCEYYLNVEVLDRPGVLASVAGVLGNHGVSIERMVQEGHGHEAGLVFITHRAREADLRATIAELDSLEVVRRIGSVIRLVGEST